MFAVGCRGLGVCLYWMLWVVLQAPKEAGVAPGPRPLLLCQLGAISSGWVGRNPGPPSPCPPSQEAACHCLARAAAGVGWAGWGSERHPRQLSSQFPSPGCAAVQPGSDSCGERGPLPLPLQPLLPSSGMLLLAWAAAEGEAVDPSPCSPPAWAVLQHGLAGQL